MNSASRSTVRTKEKIVIALVLLVAGFFRLFQIDRIPPGMHFDEAFNIFDILRLLQGQFSIFFPANHGREPLYFYLTTVAGTIFGDQALTLRLTSAVIGILTVFVFYGFGRSLFNSRLIAALAAFLLSISVWHIYYSRLGLRVILSLPLTLLTLWFFWRGICQSLNLSISQSPANPSNQSPNLSIFRSFALAGLWSSLTVYAYTSGRLLPLILSVLTLSAIVLDRAHWRDYLRGLIITGIVAFIVFIPLGYYFVTHPSDFLEHGSYLSIWDIRVNKGDVTGTFRDGIIAVAGMFLVRGDQEAFRNVPEHPVFDPIIGVLFVVGLGMLLLNLVSRGLPTQQHLRAILIAICLLAFLSLSVLSDAPPNFTRSLTAAPFAILLPAWALGAIWDRLAALRLQRIALVGVSGILFMSTAFAFNDYFVNFASSPALYYAFDVRMFDVAQWINKNSATSQIYLAPLWYQEGTVSLLTRNTTLKSFESRDTIVLPSRAAGKDALYAFPVEQENKAVKLAERLGNRATREDVFGSTGEKILVVYRVGRDDLPDLLDPIGALNSSKPQQIANTTWGGQMKLLGYSIGAADAPKRNIELTLFLQALKPMSEDYTFSLKAHDAKDRVWGQEDKWLGDNSYATTAMSAGDLAIEKFFPGLNPCAPAGEYRITLEAYNPTTNHLLGLDNSSNTSVSLGVTRAEASQGNLYENLEPEQSLALDVAPQMQLFGFSLTPGEIHVGDEFSLSLFWRGQGSGTTARQLSVRLGDATIAQRDIALPADGRGLCTLFDLRAPTTTAVGTVAVFVNDQKLTTLNILR